VEVASADENLTPQQLNAQCLDLLLLLLLLIV
jgi:hypothetical protein